jgi:cyclophilin family peptidyl-prolyl cis-trans isomerase
LELNRRFIAGTALAALVALVPGMSAQAQVASPNCTTSLSPSFVLGFAALKDQLADAMGDPIECEHANPQNGDTLQQTTRGLAFYRKSTNTPTFTNGSEHWAITGNGLVFWTGSSIDPLGTVASSNRSTGGSSTSTEGTGATGQGSLTQPFPIGQPVAIDTIAADGTSRSFETTVLAVRRGDEAFRLLKAANQFNDPPGPGLEYLLVQLRTRYTKGPPNETVNVDKYSFATTGADGVLRGPASVVLPEPQFNAKLFAGGTTEGWAAYQVTTGDPFPRIGSRLSGIDTPKLWLSLIPSPPTEAETPVPQVAHESAGSKRFAAPPPMRIDPGKHYTATIDTSLGSMKADLFASEAPTTVNNFVFLARAAFYNDVTFHRVINNFMVQTGDPTGTGTGGPGYRFNDEPVTRQYVRGTLAMANAGPNTNGSQFFIVHKDYPLPPNYTIFGELNDGFDTLDNIAVTPTGPGRGGPDTPRTSVTIRSITIQES